MTTTEKLDALQAELRIIGCHSNGDARCTCSIGADADAAITALRARVAELDADVQWMTENRNKWQDSATRRASEITKLEAELARRGQGVHVARNIQRDAEHRAMLEVVQSGSESDLLRYRYRIASALRAALVSPNVDPEHPDDLAVDRFAVAMKGKLARKRLQGRGGWEGPTCTAEFLSRLLREHVEKGDPLDVGNLAMMLHQRGERIVSPGDGWRSMDSAPRGNPSYDVGCPDASEWFLGRVSKKFREHRPSAVVIRRRAWPQGDSWECYGSTYYVPDFFDGWMPIPASEGA